MRVVRLLAGHPGLGDDLSITIQPPQTVVDAEFVNYGYAPVTVACPACRSDVTTNIEYQTGLYTWIICTLIVLTTLVAFP
jgi:hypothetical protein